VDQLRRESWQEKRLLPQELIQETVEDALAIRLNEDAVDPVDNVFSQPRPRKNVYDLTFRQRPAT
jgi:hypothetical protein